jgi:parallel beta-helix repeat protein
MLAPISRLARRLGTFGVAICLFSCTSASASVVYVNRNANGSAQNGTTWATAFQTVQGGINAATSGDEVWVAASTPAAPAYVENVTLKADVALYGGFAGAETARSQRVLKSNVTVLDGSGNADSSTVTSSVQGGVLDGFAVRNAASGYAGVLISSGGTMSVINCIISGNSYGVTVDIGTATIKDCVISGCDAGVYVSSGGTANVTNCTISGNPYGIYIRSGTTRVTNSIVAFNGRGIYRFIITNPITLSHNDVYGSTLENYKNIDDPTGFNSNIRQDPLLSSPTDGDFHLTAGSPCIDAGIDTSVTPGETDLDGNPRIHGAHVDIGAYEYGSAGAPPFTLSDAADALRIAGGLTVASGTDLTRLDVDPGSPDVDLADAVRIARKATGLDENP